MDTENNKNENMEKSHNEEKQLGNISEQEMQRDMINLHLPEIDIVGENREAELKKLYGDDYLSGLDLEDDEDNEE